MDRGSPLATYCTVRAVIDASRFFNRDVKLWDEATQAGIAQWKSSGQPARVSAARCPDTVSGSTPRNCRVGSSPTSRSKFERNV